MRFWVELYFLMPILVLNIFIQVDVWVPTHHFSVSQWTNFSIWLRYWVSLCRIWLSSFIIPLLQPMSSEIQYIFQDYGWLLMTLWCVQAFYFHFMPIMCTAIISDCWFSFPTRSFLQEILHFLLSAYWSSHLLCGLSMFGGKRGFHQGISKRKCQWSFLLCLFHSRKRSWPWEFPPCTNSTTSLFYHFNIPEDQLCSWDFPLLS